MIEEPRKNTKPQLALAIAKGNSVTAWPCTKYRANMTHRPGLGLGNASGKSEDSLTSLPETAIFAMPEAHPKTTKPQLSLAIAQGVSVAAWAGSKCVPSRTADEVLHHASRTRTR
jgi:hypothetical protein